MFIQTGPEDRSVPVRDSRPLVYLALALGAGATAASVSTVFRGGRETREALARETALRERLSAEENDRRLLHERLLGLESRLAEERALAREEHDRLAQEVERLRRQDVANASLHIATVEARVQMLREQSEREEKARRLDVALNHRELLETTVRVNARSEVGSGTLVYSRRRKDRVHTLVLTAWHIVKDNVVGEGGPAPVEIDIYDEHGKASEEKGTVVARHENLDLALVELEGDKLVPATARLPRPADLDRLTIFSRVYAIGCPLGYAPIPTSGEITSKEKELDGITYWMVNAPTIFGNSGGGIYAAESRQLIGVLSRISAYKNLIDVAVPHMGIVTPITQVYDWLETTDFAYVRREGIAPEPEVLEAGHPK
jgi:S1-C subfamily serine protease